MTDKELLELAAKAAGITLEWDGRPDKWQPMFYKGKTYHSFDPLTDDGDALRLAVKLEIDFNNANAAAWWKRQTRNDVLWMCVPHNNDPYAATRRAITRAAAEIGKTMKS
jgi:hypothetical protein